jgi:hypothetical protein
MRTGIKKANEWKNVLQRPGHDARRIHAVNLSGITPKPKTRCFSTLTSTSTGSFSAKDLSNIMTKYLGISAIAVCALFAAGLGFSSAQALRLQDGNVTVQYDSQHQGEFTPANQRYIATQTADDVRRSDFGPNIYGWVPSARDVGRKHAPHAPVARARGQADVVGTPVPVKHYPMVEDCVRVAFPQCSGGN